MDKNEALSCQGNENKNDVDNGDAQERGLLTKNTVIR